MDGGDRGVGLRRAGPRMTDDRDVLEHRDLVDEWFAGEPADAGSIIGVIARAREAQQEHERRIDVQLELGRVETEQEWPTGGRDVSPRHEGSTNPVEPVAGVASRGSCSVSAREETRP